MEAFRQSPSELIAYLNASPTPFHATASAVRSLEAAGFRGLSERESWKGLPPGRWYVVRNDSAVAAFVIPESATLHGARIVGAHTDSPNLRLKPHAEYVREGYRQLGVEVYGGALLNSWLDRDLGLAGRVIAKHGNGLGSHLFRIDRPLARVAQLAIHLDRDVNEKGLVLNRQEHLAPLLGLVSAGESPTILELCSRAAGVALEDVVGFDAMLHDVNPSCTGGAHDELIFSARLDNLAMCHAAISSLIGAASEPTKSSLLPVAILFDHEEVGSSSTAGAGAPFLPTLLERVVAARQTDAGRDDYHAFIARSMCVSADMAHAVHPNHPDRHEARHKPVLNGGPVIKSNAQQRYATNGRTAAHFRTLCEHANVPFQVYVHRTDLPCGTTIGPITATLLGIPTVDVGNPMLSMHSAREMSGSADPAMMEAVLKLFYTTG